MEDEVESGLGGGGGEREDNNKLQRKWMNCNGSSQS